MEWARRRCGGGRAAYKSHKFYEGIKVTLTAAQARELWERDGAAKMVKPSLDRVDPRGDYSFENCRIIEHAVNIRLPHEGESVPAWVIEEPEFT